MTLDEYDPEDALLEISRKLSSVSIYKIPEYEEQVEKQALPTMKYLLFSSETEQVKQSIRLLRKYLTQGHSDEAFIDDILSLDILPRIKQLMESDTDDAIKFECAWIITNIAAGTALQTDTVVMSNFVDTLLALVNSNESDMDLKAQCAWALGNIAGEAAYYRQELMIAGFTTSVVNVLNTIYEYIHNNAMEGAFGYSKWQLLHDNMYANVEALLWTLSNMSRGGFRTAEFYQLYVPIFEVFVRYIASGYTKLEVEVCWGLSRVLYNMHEVTGFHEKAIITEELCIHLCNMIREGVHRVVLPAIRTVVNITSGPNSDIIRLLKTPILTSITRLLEPDAPRELKKDAYLVISNIAAGNEDTIQQVVLNRVVMINVIAHIAVPGHTFSAKPIRWTPSILQTQYESSADEWKLTKEALWIVFNIMSTGSDQSVWTLLREHPNMTGNLVALLSYGNLPLTIYEKTMDAIISLVQRSNKWADRYSDRINPFVHRLLECHLLDILQQYNESESRSKLERLVAASVEDMLKTNEITDGIVNEFGLPTASEMRSKSNKRRVIRGLEDGDVRLIENAVGNLNIME